MTTYRLIFHALIAVAAFTFAGCASKTESSKDGAPQTSSKLVIASPHGGEIQAEFERLWKKSHPDTQIKWVDKGGSSGVLRFVQAQFKGKSGQEGIGVDCFFGGGMEGFLDLEKSGYLQPLPGSFGVPATLNGVPLRGDKNTWVAAALSEFGILYNKSIATRDQLPIPAVWSDLGHPKLIDRVELADPRHSGSAHATYEIILQTNGWKNGWKTLLGMTANARRFVREASNLTKDVANGEAVFVTAIDFYARGAIDRAGDEKLGYISPRGQGVVTPDPIGVLRGAPNPELARKWVAFVLSPEAQKLWLLPKGSSGGPTQNSLFRQAALPKTYQPIPSGSLIPNDPYATKTAYKYDAGKAALRRRVIDDLIGATLVENHDAIRRWWKSDPNPNRLNWLPASEEEVSKAAEKWDDESFRSQTLSRWSAAAAKHFGS